MRRPGSRADPRGTWRLVARLAFAALFLISGVGHFVATGFYLRIMPPYLPFHRALVLVSGAIEIALGILLLVPRYSRWAAWGLVALLIAVFPANIYVYQTSGIDPRPAPPPPAAAAVAGGTHRLGLRVHEAVAAPVETRARGFRVPRPGRGAVQSCAVRSC
jgi:uncharacterized membrane protein